MATATTNPNTKPTTRRAASVDPDAMIATGLANNFHGTPTMRYTARKYEKGKKAGTWYLANRVEIATDDPDVGGGLVTEYYRVADLKEWVPSLDGETPMVISFDDYLALHNGEGDLDEATMGAIAGTHLAPTPKGTQANVPNNTKHAQLMRSIRDCGFPKDRMGASLDFIDGVGCDWSRLPYVSPGGGSMTLEEGQRAPETLCVTGIDLDSIPAAKSTKGSTTTAKAAVSTSATPTATTDLEPQIDQAIVAALTSAPDNQLHKSKLGNPILKSFPGKVGMQAIKFLNNNEWLGAAIEREAGYMFDVDSGTLTLLG